MNPHEVLEVLRNPSEYTVSTIEEALSTAIKIIELVDDWSTLINLAKVEPLDDQVTDAEDAILDMFVDQKEDSHG